MNAQELKSLADAQFNRAQQRKILKEKAYAARTVAHNGGLFFASLELIALLQSVDNITIIEDTYQNPIKIDRRKLLDDLVQVYNSAMETWYNEFESSNRIRRGSNV